MLNLFQHPIVLLLALIITLSSCQLGSTSTSSSVDIPVLHPYVNPDTSIKLKDTINITAVGDIMLGSPYPVKTNLPSDDAVHSFRKVNDFLKGDVIFGNLEGCFLDTGKSVKCKDTLSTSCYAFRMPVRYAPIIKKAGFNVMSIANNHIGDFEDIGRKRTMDVLDSLNISYAGLESHPYAFFEKDSVKYAFCAFAPNQNTLQISNIDSAKALVSRLKQQANIVIVSFHGGAEGSLHEHVPKKDEIYFKENRGNVYAFAHAVIDAGADVVLGHGPHVTRAIEVYKNKFIAYSLGNFCTFGMFNLKGPNGIAPLLQLKVNSKGDFLFADIVSVRQDKVKRLNLDPAYGAFKKMKYLTDTDFPGHRLIFSGSGRIQQKPD